MSIQEKHHTETSFHGKAPPGRNINAESAGSVKDRLLNVAEELFAERGFNSTSVRDLASEAGCNIASVNYYFGGKEKLYIEVWRRHLHVLRDARVDSIDKVLSESEDKPDLEDLLRSFSYAFIGPLIDEKGGPRLIKLMAREMLNPHLPPRMLGDEVMIPTLSAMRNALGKACPKLPESKIALVVFSLIGQLMHTIKLKAMFGSMDTSPHHKVSHEQQRNQDNENLPRFEPGEVIDHIVAFSAAGIRVFAGGEIE